MDHDIVQIWCEMQRRMFSANTGQVWAGNDVSQVTRQSEPGLRSVWPVTGVFEQVANICEF